MLGSFRTQVAREDPSILAQTRKRVKSSSFCFSASLVGPSNLRPRGSVGLRTDDANSITWTTTRGLAENLIHLQRRIILADSASLMEGLARCESDVSVLVSLRSTCFEYPLACHCSMFEQHIVVITL